MEGDEQETEEEGLPGPPPDPSRIPSIVRKVGDLNLQSEADDPGISKKTDPAIRAIMEFLDEVEDLEPLSNNLSGDPMAEAWLQILLTLIVREHGHSSLGVSTIEVLVREGIDLEIFLDRRWIMGRLEKVYGGAEVSYSPNPSWLEMK